MSPERTLYAAGAKTYGTRHPHHLKEPTISTPDAPPPSSIASIQAAATRLFSERGYAGATMREIAKSVGLLPGSLYAHISSKEELLQGIAETGIDHFLTASSALDPTLPVPERMRLAIRAHVVVVAENPQRTRVVFHEWRFLSRDKQQAIIRKRARYEAIFTTLIREGIETGVFSPRLDARIAVMEVLGALNWTAEWLRADGARSADSIGDEIAEIVLRGLVRPALAPPDWGAP